MKLNNKGFAISTVMYMILIMAIVLITLTLSILSARKLILDRIRKETSNNIYNVYEITYRQVLEILKEEALTYKSNNTMNTNSIKIEDLNSSIDEEILDGYNLSGKYLTINNDKVYLGRLSTITDISTSLNKFIDIYDYKIYGNSVQNGTPTPSNPVEVQSVGDKTKNLYVDIASLYTKPVNYYILPITLEQGATYVMSCELAGQEITNSVVVGIAKTGTKYADFGSFYYTLHTGTREKYFTQTFTIDSSWTAPKLAIYASSQEQIAQIFENYHIQLEKSSTKTSYEPYGKYKIPITVSDGTNSTTTNIYLNEPLRKLGNAIDYIDFETQKVVRYVKKLEPSGIIVNFTNGSQYANGNCRCQFGNLENNVDFAIPPMSNGSVGNVENIVSSPNNVTATTRYNSFYWYFDATDVGLTPVTSTTSNSTIGTAIKNYITNNNINLQYAMVQPTEEIVSLDKINYGEYTEISVDTLLSPSNIEFSVIEKILEI